MHPVVLGAVLCFSLSVCQCLCAELELCLLWLGLVEQQLAGRTASEPVSALYLIMLLIYRAAVQKDYSIRKIIHLLIFISSY